MAEITTSPLADYLGAADYHFLYQSGSLKRLPQTVINEVTEGVGFYNGKHYGMVADGTTDNTAALLNIIALIATKSQNSEIFLPDEGTYLFNGAFLDTSRSNCIIKFPSVAITAKYYTITIRGFKATTFSPSAYDSAPPPSATYIKTTVNSASGSQPSLIGGIGPVGGVSAETSYITVQLKDLIVVTPPNPVITAVNFNNFTNCGLENVAVLAGGKFSVLDTVAPTTSTSFGVIHPAVGHGVLQRIKETCMIIGFYNGIRVGENAFCDDLEVYSCRYGATFGASNGVSNISKLSVGWCKYGMTFTAAHRTQIQTLNIERWQPPYGSVTTQWYDFVNDIQDPSNFGSGELIYTGARANVGVVPGYFLKNGGNNIYIREIGVSPAA